MADIAGNRPGRPRGGHNVPGGRGAAGGRGGRGGASGPGSESGSGRGNPGHRRGTARGANSGRGELDSRGRGRAGRGGRSGSTAGDSPGRAGHPGAAAGGRGRETTQTATRPSIPHINYNSFTFRNSLNHNNGFGNGIAATKMSAQQMKEILEDGLEKVKDSNLRQDFVNDIANTEDGVRQIRQIVETDFSLSYSVLDPMFQPHCILFLQLITREEILNSVLLEKAKGTIYNVIYGLDGSKGIEFFKRVASCLVQLRLEVEGGDESAAMNRKELKEALLVATESLYWTVKLNHGASIKTEFRGILQGLCTCYDIDDTDPLLRFAHQNVVKIEDLLSVGDSLSVSGSRASRSAQQQPPERANQLAPPTLPVDLPGLLSGLGLRHDNDHELISNIRILPTTSEILCYERKDFLLTRNAFNTPSQHHETGIRRLLDSQFRLLREDTSGLVRDSIRVILGNWNTLIHDPDWKTKRRILRDECPTPVRLYSGVQIQLIRHNPKTGIEVQVEFNQVNRARRLNYQRRWQYWRESKELKEGGPVMALIAGDGKTDVTVVFFLVSKREINSRDYRKQLTSAGAPLICDLASDAERSMITLRLASSTYKPDQSSLIYLATNNGPSAPSPMPLILVEFPALLYNSFEGVLRRLQSLRENPVVPFTAWLAPRLRDASTQDPATTARNAATSIPPPAYLTAGTAIDLSCIPKSVDGTTTNAPLTFSLSRDPGELATQLATETTLDTGQAVAMVSALRHEVALIQGPPGTGKSFVGIQIASCLLKSRDRLGLGPLLCVCYTSHALDQFLHELLDSGVTSILRMGSRSLSQRLEKLSLEEYKKNTEFPRISGLGKQIADCKKVLAALKEDIEKVCRQVQEGSAGIARKFLENRFKTQALSIFGMAHGLTDEEALETWVSGDGPGDLGAGDTERSIEELALLDPWSLKNKERNALWQYWMDTAFADLMQRLQYLMRRHSVEKQQFTSLFHESDRRILDQVHVVGVTTTGLANNADLLRGLRARVLICEEAGEVLESHVLTALLPSVQHTIMIGDHLQLRPRISNLRLSMEYDRDGPKYNLDESLFERLANSRLGEHDQEPFPIAQLDHQRRMHPSISSLIRDTLYPALRDHPATAAYPPIPGMRRRLFWLDHRNFEDAGDPSEPMQSKTNMWEARMVTALVRHLSRQGRYRPGEIAVLTPYLGQLRMLREMLDRVAELVIGERDLEKLEEEEENEGSEAGRGKKEREQRVERGKLLDGLRMATVDNFQGEEATVVIVSLVRSNARRVCGFLKTPNRINVLLSRAKHGMYIIGNAETSAAVPMWKSVIKILEKGRNIDRRLELHCPRHPDNRTYVSEPDDFASRAPEGGCAEQCRLRLDCGHSCTLKCHTKALHAAARCLELCTRMRDCGHPCSKKCSALCGECGVKVADAELQCGHTAEVECGQMGNLDSVKCTERVTRENPGCGHQVTLACHIDLDGIRCEHSCDSLLLCGHDCRKQCSACRQIRDDGSVQIDHGSCGIPCGRVFTTCSHTCAKACHAGTPCPPCKRPCEVRCKHSRCSKTCSDPCPPCAVLCGWGCDHRQDYCNMPCAVPCDVVPCHRRCEKILVPCGHRCPGVCGEACPDRKYCKSCCTPDILERNVDLIMFAKYEEIQLDDDPLIFLSCKHFYTISSLDGIMELNEHYVTDDETGQILRPKPSLREVASGAAPKGCPECRMPLRDIDRYNRVVKRALLDEATRRFVAQANARCADLVGAIAHREGEMEGESRAFVAEWSHSASLPKGPREVDAALKEYQAKGHALLGRINRFTKSVEKTEQPFGRVNSIFASAAARRRDVATNAFELDESAIQTGFQFRGQCFSLRLNWAILWDYDTISSNSNVDTHIRFPLRDATTARLEGLMDRCRSLQKSSHDAKLPQHEAEARIYHALFSMLSLSNARARGQATDSDSESSTRQRERESLRECDALCSRYPGSLAYLKDDVDKAVRLVNGGTFYSFVTTEEKKEVYRVMAEQFSGTGHWYYCQNNHPFTVGECGMPMEQARCPQCEAPVGGRDHVPVAGVRRAEDFEAEFSGVGLSRDI